MNIKIIYFQNKMSQDQAESNIYIQPTANPQAFNHPIFYKNKITTSKDKREKVTYNNIGKYVQKRKSNICLSDQQFLKTSSCLSSSQKYDVIGDILDNNTYNLRRNQKNNQVQFRKKSKENRSQSNRIIILTPQAQQQLIGKVTIHCLRAQGSALKQECKQVESQYRYMLKKIGQFKKSKILEDLREKKIYRIISQKRKFSQDLHNNLKKYQQNQRRSKQNAKKEILIHRKRKNQSIMKKKIQNNNSASQQRLYEEQIHDRIQHSFWAQYNKKRKKCQNQKIAHQQRRKNITNKIQARKLQGRSQFRNRWLCELQKTQQAKQQLINKKQQIQSKMKEAFQNWANTYYKEKT